MITQQEQGAKRGNVVVRLQSRRGIYLLPNLFTTAGMLAGFFAIIKATQGQYEAAALAVFFAMLMDALDGRIARWTHTTSEFGLQYDSLADLVAFGIAPAMVMYEWALSNLGKTGWLVAFYYVAMTAARLARFNTREGDDKRYFLGMPSPAAAAVMVGAVWVMFSADMDSQPFYAMSAVLTVAVATAMFSNVSYRSFKDVNFKGKLALVVLVWTFIVLMWEPRTLFAVFFAYFLSGPSMMLWRWVRRGRSRSTEEPAPVDPEV